MHHLSVFEGGVEYHVNYNSDWSGEAIIAYHAGGSGAWTEVRLPGALLRTCGRAAALADFVATVERIK